MTKVNWKPQGLVSIRSETIGCLGAAHMQFMVFFLSIQILNSSKHSFPSCPQKSCIWSANFSGGINQSLELVCSFLLGDCSNVTDGHSLLHSCKTTYQALATDFYQLTDSAWINFFPFLQEVRFCSTDNKGPKK